MQIKVKLFATLREGRGKVLDLEVKKGSSVSDILKKLEITPDDIALLLVNGKDGDFNIELSHGDVISLFPPVGGG